MLHVNAISNKVFFHMHSIFVFIQTVTNQPDPTVQWYISGPAFSLLHNVSSSLADLFFTGSNTFSSVALSASTILVETFTNYDTFAAAIQNNQTNKNTRFILYDNENWTFTPLEQQINFKHYFSLFCNLARKNKYQCILTPAIDLASKNPACFGATQEDRYLNCSIPYAAAETADIFEIQAQGDEESLANYVSLVSQAAAQARRANSQIVVWAGLSTNPNGMNVTGQQLFECYEGTVGSVVSGYWLNIPGNSAYCNRCTLKPQVAADFLNLTLSSCPKNE